MQRQPLPYRPQPKANTPREMTEAEQAQAYRELLALHSQVTKADEIIYRAQQTRAEASGQFNALLTKGLVASGRAGVGPCTTCGYDFCQCERIG